MLAIHGKIDLTCDEAVAPMALESSEEYRKGDRSRVKDIRPDGMATQAKVAANDALLTYMKDGAETDRRFGEAVDLLVGAADQDILIVGDGGEALIIPDFDPDRDTIVLLYDPAGPEPMLEIRIDDTGATLFADGSVVATLPGATEVRTDAIVWVAD